MVLKSAFTVVFLMALNWSGGHGASPSHPIGESTLSPLSPWTRGLALPQPQPFALTAQGVRTAMHRWIAAYNAHDAPTVLAYLADQRLRYFDCEYVTHHGYLLTSRATVQVWLRHRWARGDHVQLRRITVGDYGWKPGTPIHVIGLEVHRTSRETPRGVDIGFKLLPLQLPGPRGLIQTAALAGNTQCPLFKVE